MDGGGGVHACVRVYIYIVGGGGGEVDVMAIYMRMYIVF